MTLQSLDANRSEVKKQHCEIHTTCSYISNRKLEVGFEVQLEASLFLLNPFDCSITC